MEIRTFSLALRAPFRGRTAYASLAAVALGATLAACGPRRAPVMANAPSMVDVWIDTSGSDRARLPGYLVLVGKLADRLPKGCWLRIHRFDSDTETIFDRPLDVSKTALIEELQPKLLGRSRNPGTRHDLLLADVRSISRSATCPFAVVVLSDFMATDLTNPRISGMKADAAELSSNRKLRAFAVIGAVPASSKFLEAVLAPLGAKKLMRMDPRRPDLGAIAGAVG